MNGLTVIENTAIVEQRTINADLFSRWTSYIDASPKTIETVSYTHLDVYKRQTQTNSREPYKKNSKHSKCTYTLRKSILERGLIHEASRIKKGICTA